MARKKEEKASRSAEEKRYLEGALCGDLLQYLANDLFGVFEDGTGFKLTWVSTGGIAFTKIPELKIERCVPAFTMRLLCKIGWKQDSVASYLNRMGFFEIKIENGEPDWGGRVKQIPDGYTMYCVTACLKPESLMNWKFRTRDRIQAKANEGSNGSGAA